MSVAVPACLGGDHRGPVGSRCDLQWIRSDLSRRPTSSHSRVEEVRVSETEDSTQGSGTSSGTHPRAPCQTGHRTRTGQNVPRTLQPHVPCPQKGRQTSAYHQSEKSEFLSGRSNVSDGDSLLSSRGCPTGGLGHFSGPHGRVLSCTNSALVQEVPQDCGQWADIPISCPSLRSIHLTESVHKDAGAGGSVSSLQRHSHSQVPGRLSHKVSVQGPVFGVDSVHPGSSLPSRSRSESGEVGSDTISDLPVYRHSVSHGSRDHGPTRGQIADYTISRRTPPFGESSSISVAIPHRVAGFGGEAGAVRQASHPSDPFLCSSPVPPGGSPSRETSRSRPASSSGHPLVAGQEQYPQGSAAGSLQSGPNPEHGCQHGRLGCSCSGLSSLRGLDSPATTPVFHQSSGAVSRDSGPSIPSQFLEREEGDGGHRQFNSRGLHKPSRWDQVHDSFGSGLRPVLSGRPVGNDHQGPSHSGEVELLGRSPLTATPSGRNRVVSAPRNSQSHLECLGQTSPGPHGNQSEPSVTSVRQSLSRPSGSCGRRNVLVLGGTGRVHLSTVANDPQGTSEATDSQLYADSGPSSVAQQSMVSTVARESSGQAQKTSSRPRPSVSTSQRPSARADPFPGSTRLSTVFDEVVNQGFSAEVSKRITEGGRTNSTLAIYDSKWQKFSLWCSQRGTDPLRAPVPEVAEFMNHLFVDLELAPVTIEGYRSAIDSVWLPFSGRTLAGNNFIIQLIANFKSERPRPVNRIPKWDLNVVLRYLRLPKFHPSRINDCPLYFSQKTVFLALLALSRRCQDIHAFDPKRISEDPRAVHICPYPGYVGKIKSTAEGRKRFLPMTIRKLHALTVDPDELLLCAASSVLIYHKWAKKRNPSRERFFISTQRDGHPVTKSTVASWVKKLIREAYSYTETDSQALALATPKVHEIRAVAASLALQSTFSLEDILGAAQWSTPSVFASFYLRDVSSFDGKMHAFGPVIVAGQRLG